MGERGQRRGRRRAHTCGVEQAAAREREHPAPGIGQVAFHGSGGRDRRSIQPLQGEHLIQQPALADAGLALEEQQDGPTRARRPRRLVQQSGELLGAAGERRPDDVGLVHALRRTRAPHAALSAHALDHRPGLLTRLGVQLRQPRLEPVRQLEGTGAVARQGHAADDGAERSLRERLDRERASRHLGRVGRARGPRERIGRAQEHVDPAAAPVLALGREPVLERDRVGHAEALEELSDHELGGRRPALGGDELLQPFHVELHRAGGEPHLADGHLHARGTGMPAEHAERLAERMPSGGLAPVRPQERGEVFTASGLTGGPGEVDEECEVLAPEQLGRRGLAIDGDLDGPEGAAYDHRWLRSARRE